MAVSPTTETTAQDDAVSSVTTSSFTVASGELLVILVGTTTFGTAETVSGVTWNSLSLTKAVSISQATGAQAQWHEVSIWYLHISSGATATATVTLTGTCDDLLCAAISCTGHNTSSPIGDTDTTYLDNGGGVEPSLTLTTVSGDLVVDCLQIEDAANLTEGAGQTAIYEDVTANNFGSIHTSHEAATGSSVTMSWTRALDRGYDYCAAVITASTGGGTTYNVSPTVTATGVVRVVRQAQLLRIATGGHSPKVIRQGNLTRKVSATGVASVTAQLVRIISVLATALGVAKVIRQANLTKAVQGGHTLTVSRTGQLVKKVVGAHTVSLSRVGQLIRAVSHAGVASVAFQAVKIVSVVATALGIATLQRQANLTLSTQATGVPTLVRKGLLVLAASAVGVAGVSLSLSPGGLVTLTLTAVAAAVVSVGVFVITARKPFTGQAGLGLFMKMKRRWTKRYRKWTPTGGPK